MVSATRQRFNEEFRRNLDAGNKTFEFEGKTYNTKMAPSSEGPPRRGLGSPVSLTVSRSQPADDSSKPESSSPKSLSDWYKKYPDSFPSKYGPSEGSSEDKESSPQTEAQRVGEARSDLMKERDTYKSTQPTERTGKMLDDLRSGMEKLNTARKEQGYKKGGMVRKKATGGSIRGCGLATKGHGKMRMF